MSTHFLIVSIRTTIAIVALSGNIISYLVFSSKKFINNSISTYCRSLALVESLTLTQLVIDVYYELFNEYLQYKSDFLCKTIAFLTTQYGAIPGWILMAFSLDKMLNMRRKVFSIMKKKHFQWLTVYSIVIFNLLFYVYTLFLFKLTPSNINNQTVLTCDVSLPKFTYVVIIASLFQSTLIPFIIMFITSILIISSLCRSRGSLERFTNRTYRNRRIRDRNYAISSLILNFKFILFRIPMFVYYGLNALNIDQSDFFFQLSFLLYFLNSTMTFFIHISSNLLFRQEIFNFFRLLFTTKTPINL